MPDRWQILRDRAKPSRGSIEHQKLRADLGGVQPAEDHPLYPEYVRLTDPRPMGRPVAPEVSRGERPKAGTPEYEAWWRQNTDAGKAMYEQQKARQTQQYHDGPYGSGARQRAEQRQRPGLIQGIKQHYEQSGAPIDDAAAEELYRQERDQGIPAMRGRLPVEETADRWPVLDPIRGDAERLAATKAKPKPKPPRKPEEVWYDVHKHPEGTPGGMGKSPEHHLRNRGWRGHEVNEGSGKKTIQYRHQDYPNFVISYGGGSGTKPDHNFRILHMGINTNIPKVTRAYSVAEAMNKVEELHGLGHGLVVQPMTHGAAVAQPLGPEDIPDVPKIPDAPQRDMDNADAFPDFPSKPVNGSGWNDKHEYQLHQIPAPPNFRKSSWEDMPVAHSMHLVRETNVNWEDE